MNYTIVMSSVFQQWLETLEVKNPNAAGRISSRINRVAAGNFGDHKLLKAAPGIIELRFGFDQGYRLYISRRGYELIVVLCGGDKTTQTEDVKNAKLILKQF